jgi:prevent-host-death family protein
MPSVAAKELKNRLGHFLRLVRRGARFLVTDRGRPVAQLAPLSEEHRDNDELEAELQRAAAQGAIRMAKGRKLPVIRPVRVRKGAELSNAVIEDRG